MTKGKLILVMLLLFFYLRLISMCWSGRYRSTVRHGRSNWRTVQLGRSYWSLGAHRDVVLSGLDDGGVLRNDLSSVSSLGLELGPGDVLGLVLDLRLVPDLGPGENLGPVLSFGDILGLELSFSQVLGLVGRSYLCLILSLSDVLLLVLGSSDVLGNELLLDLCLVLGLDYSPIDSVWNHLCAVDCGVGRYLLNLSAILSNKLRLRVARGWGRSRGCINRSRGRSRGPVNRGRRCSISLG